MNGYKTLLLMYIVGLLESLLHWLTGADGIQYFYTAHSREKAMEKNGCLPFRSQRENSYIPEWGS